jgi:hypothetical protein
MSGKPIGLSSSGDGFEELDFPSSAASMLVNFTSQAAAQPPAIEKYNRSYAARTGPIGEIRYRQTLLSFRNVSEKTIELHRLGVGVVCTKPTDMPLLVECALVLSRSWSAPDQGGYRAAHKNSTNVISGTAVGWSADAEILFTGSQQGIYSSKREIDANPVSLVTGYLYRAQTGVVIALQQDNLYKADSLGPLIIPNKQGFIVLLGDPPTAGCEMDFCFHIGYSVRANV